MPNISEVLECPVCLEVLDREHKVLPCQHTFCTKCLGDVRSKLRSQAPDQGCPELICPECRTPCPTPLEQLPSNVILNRILEEMNNPVTPAPPRATPTFHVPPTVSVQGATPTSGTNVTPTSTKESFGATPTRSSPIAESFGVTPKPVATPSMPGDVDRKQSIPGNLATNPFVPLLDSPAVPDPISPVPLLPPKPSFFSGQKSSQPPPSLPAKPSPKPATRSAGHQIYKAIFDYVPCKEDELALKKNELYIVIEKCRDGWYKGSTIQGLQTGVFPGNYVQHIQHEQQVLLPRKAESTKSKDTNKINKSPNLIDLPNNEMEETLKKLEISPWTPSSKTPPNITATSSNFQQIQARMRASATSRRPALNPLPRPPQTSSRERYRCLMSYPASGEYELDLKEGDLIIMLKKRDDGWCKGMKEGTEKVGLFPATFVTKIS